MTKAAVLVMLTLVCSASVSGYPYNVNVTDIKANSARLYWKSTESDVEEFLIQCVGTQFYAVARDGRVHNTEMHVRSQFVPPGLEGIRIGDLRPNYNYTCVIQETLPEDAPVLNGILSGPLTFTTDYADPTPPKAPVIIKEEGITRVNIFKSPSEKFGPINGYKVQFHVVENSFLGDVAVIDRDFTSPYGKFSPASLEYAQTTQRALSFQMSYSNDDVPSYIQIDSDLLNGALKNGYLYRVVTVPYTKRKDGVIAFTPSHPSDSFIAVGVDKYISQGRFLNDMKMQQFKIGIAAGILIPLLCLMYMCFVGMLLLCREKHQASVYKEENEDMASKKRCTWENIRRCLLACGMGCCIKCWKYFCRCCPCCKGGARYQRVGTDELPRQRSEPVVAINETPSYHEPQPADPAPQLSRLLQSSTDDEVPMYSKAPSMVSRSSPNLQRRLSPIPSHKLLSPKSSTNIPLFRGSKQHEHMQSLRSLSNRRGYSSRHPSSHDLAKSQSYRSGRSERSHNTATSRRIKMPAPLAGPSLSHDLAHISASMSRHDSHHAPSHHTPSRQPSHHAPSHHVPSHHASSHHVPSTRSQHSAVSGYKFKMIPKYSPVAAHTPSSLHRTPTISHAGLSPHASHQQQMPATQLLSQHSPAHRRQTLTSNHAGLSPHASYRQHTPATSPTGLSPYASHRKQSHTGLSPHASHRRQTLTSEHAGLSPRASYRQQTPATSRTGSPYASDRQRTPATSRSGLSPHASHRRQTLASNHAGLSPLASYRQQTSAASLTGLSPNRQQTPATSPIRLSPHASHRQQSLVASRAGMSPYAPFQQSRTRELRGSRSRGSHHPASHHQTPGRISSLHSKRHSRPHMPQTQAARPAILKRNSVPANHLSRHGSPIPWTTVTAPSQSTHRRRSNPQTPITSPQFERISGTQPLPYITSASAAFNTAEEFSTGARGKSSDLFLPHLNSGTSALSLSMSQQPSRLPGNGQGYELISLSSSLMGDSEPTAMDVLH